MNNYYPGMLGVDENTFRNAITVSPGILKLLMEWDHFQGIQCELVALENRIVALYRGAGTPLDSQTRSQNNAYIAGIDSVMNQTLAQIRKEIEEAQVQKVKSKLKA